MAVFNADYRSLTIDASPALGLNLIGVDYTSGGYDTLRFTREEYNNCYFMVSKNEDGDSIDRIFSTPFFLKDGIMYPWSKALAERRTEISLLAPSSWATITPSGRGYFCNSDTFPNHYRPRFKTLCYDRVLHGRGQGPARFESKTIPYACKNERTMLFTSIQTFVRLGELESEQWVTWEADGSATFSPPPSIEGFQYLSDIKVNENRFVRRYRSHCVMPVFTGAAPFTSQMMTYASLLSAVVTPPPPSSIQNTYGWTPSLSPTTLRLFNDAQPRKIVAGKVDLTEFASTKLLNANPTYVKYCNLEKSKTDIFNKLQNSTQSERYYTQDIVYAEQQLKQAQVRVESLKKDKDRVQKDIAEYTTVFNKLSGELTAAQAQKDKLRQDSLQNIESEKARLESVFKELGIEILRLDKELLIFSMLRPIVITCSKSKKKIVAGPYDFKIDLVVARVQLKLKNKDSIFGVWNRQNYKAHPHSAVCGISTNMFDWQSPCLGEAQSAIYSAVSSKDITYIIYAVLAWASSANEDDSWGRENSGFPLLESIALDTKKELPESLQAKTGHNIEQELIELLTGMVEDLLPEDPPITKRDFIEAISFYEHKDKVNSELINKVFFSCMEKLPDDLKVFDDIAFEFLDDILNELIEMMKESEVPLTKEGFISVANLKNAVLQTKHILTEEMFDEVWNSHGARSRSHEIRNNIVGVSDISAPLNRAVQRVTDTDIIAAIGEPTLDAVNYIGVRDGPTPIYVMGQVTPVGFTRGVRRLDTTSPRTNPYSEIPAGTDYVETTTGLAYTLDLRPDTDAPIEADEDDFDDDEYQDDQDELENTSSDEPLVINNPTYTPITRLTI